MMYVIYRKLNILLIFCIFFAIFDWNSFAFAQSTVEVSMTHLNFDKVSDVKWSTLSSKKIFFGHHSVGDDIVNGMTDIDRQFSYINLNIKRTHDPASIGDHGIFAHGGVGQNFDPLSKIREFKSLMDNGMGNKLDIAFMKFCFVDIGTETDMAALFNSYKSAMAQLEHEYPNVIIVHVTVPLYVEPQGIKSLVKQKIKLLIGKNDLYENTAKYRYNSLLRKEYSGKEPIFDLAHFESTYQDGRRLTYPGDGVEYEALIPEYSSDGGHLNKLGQEILAKALLTFLANFKPVR